MKKRIFVMIAVCLALVMLLTACGSKEAITENTFSEKAQAYNMSTGSSDEIIRGVDVYVYASHPDGWAIDFFKCKSVDAAEDLYDNNIEAFQAEGTVSSETNVNGDNYSRYEAEHDGEYIYCCCVEDTLVSTRTTSDHKDAVKEFVNMIGY